MERAHLLGLSSVGRQVLRPYTKTSRTNVPSPLPSPPPAAVAASPASQLASVVCAKSNALSSSHLQTGTQVMHRTPFTPSDERGTDRAWPPQVARLSTASAKIEADDVNGTVHATSLCSPSSANSCCGSCPRGRIHAFVNAKFLMQAFSVAILVALVCKTCAQQRGRRASALPPLPPRCAKGQTGGGAHLVRAHGVQLGRRVDNEYNSLRRAARHCRRVGQRAHVPIAASNPCWLLLARMMDLDDG